MNSDVGGVDNRGSMWQAVDSNQGADAVVQGQIDWANCHDSWTAVRHSMQSLGCVQVIREFSPSCRDGMRLGVQPACRAVRGVVFE